MLSLSSCDMFRKLAGRPTAADLNDKRIEMINQELIAHKSIIDSLKLNEKKLLDSVAVLNAIIEGLPKMQATSKFGGLYNTELGAAYYVIVGIFKDEKNAITLIDEASEQGYFPTIIKMKNGNNMVALAGSQSFSSALLSLMSVRREDFCPEDAWILLNK